jgi:hypothetical protein
LLFECAPVWPDFQIDMLPVVQARALEVALGQRKSEWLDKVQRGSRRQTGSTGVPGIPVDFRVNQHHMGGRCHSLLLEHDLPALDRCYDVEQGVAVAHGIAVDDHDVGQLPRFERADLSTAKGRYRCVFGDDLDDVLR